MFHLILSIVSIFAKSPAFTQEWFFVSAAGLTTSQYYSDNGYCDYDDITTYANTTPVSAEEADEQCLLGATFICAVAIPEWKLNNSMILEQADLDYLQANRSAATIVIKFKN